MYKSLAAVLAFCLFTYFYLTRQTSESEQKPSLPAISAAAPPPASPVRTPKPASAPSGGANAIAETPPPEAKVVKEKTKTALKYKIHNGMFVVQGDIVAGAVIQGENPPPNGLVELDPLQLWPNVIPFHIQPDVSNPERVLAAIQMFSGTAVKFVPHTLEDYALVFEQGDDLCLSYVGKVVAKQQIWISPKCSASDIVHEIMHALGFVHEQNRADRDSHIEVNFDNIEEDYAHNFEKLPQEFMKVSQLGEFDFQSAMMYPPTMFAKGGRNTMEPKDRARTINPTEGLSRGDIERINRAYGRH